jgi:hypothetical protein
VSPVFIGRQEEMTVLMAMLSQAADGVPAVALIGGEAPRLVADDDLPGANAAPVRGCLRRDHRGPGDRRGTAAPWLPGAGVRAQRPDVRVAALTVLGSRPAPWPRGIIAAPGRAAA